MNHLQLDKFDEINTSLFQLNVNPTLDHLIQNKLENKEFIDKAPKLVVDKFNTRMNEKTSLKNKILKEIKSL